MCQAIIRKGFYFCIFAVYIHFKLGTVFFDNSYKGYDKVAVRMIGRIHTCNVLVISKLPLFVTLIIPVMSYAFISIKIASAFHSITIRVELINSFL